MFGRLPAYGFYCRHVKGLRLRQVEFAAAAKEERPAIVCDDVKDLELSGLRTTATTTAQPVVKLIQARQALVQNCSAPAHAKTFLEVQGEQTERVVLLNNELSAAEKAAAAGSGVPKGALIVSGNAPAA
jgi:hypothetical protein